MADILDPNPAIVCALGHLMKVRQKAVGDATFEKHSINVPEQTLYEREPLAIRIQAKNKETLPCIERLEKLASELGFEMEHNEEMITLTVRKFA